MFCNFLCAFIRGKSVPLIFLLDIIAYAHRILCEQNNAAYQILLGQLVSFQFLNNELIIFSNVFPNFYTIAAWDWVHSNISVIWYNLSLSLPLPLSAASISTDSSCNVWDFRVVNVVNIIIIFACCRTFYIFYILRCVCESSFFSHHFKCFFFFFFFSFIFLAQFILNTTWYTFIKSQNKTNTGSHHFHIIIHLFDGV